MTEISEIIMPPKRELIKPGWHLDIPNEEYHRSNGTSSSQIKTLMEQTGAHLEYNRTHPKPPTAPMGLGTATHSLVLEPWNFEKDIAVTPGDVKKPTSAQLNAKNGPTDKTLELIEFWESFALKNKGKTVISEAQLEVAQTMAKKVREHPIAGILVQDLIVESSVFQWYKSMDPDDRTEYKELLKVRPDGVSRSHKVLIDFKTTADGSYSGFIKSIQNFYYHLSAAMYLEICNRCKPLLEEIKTFAFTKFIFVCVENFAPYEVSIYELSPEYRQLGLTLFRQGLYNLHKARNNDWPGYPEEVRLIEPPSWASRGFIV